MSKKITIPITDHEDEGVCTIWYDVTYKLNTEVSYTQMLPVYGDTIEIDNLAADAEYNIRITRNCCNGSQSTAAELTIET